jgi:hypothetical protein
MVKTGSCFAVRYWPDSSGRSIEGDHRSPGDGSQPSFDAHPASSSARFQPGLGAGQFRLPLAGQYQAAIDNAAFVLVLGPWRGRRRLSRGPVVSAGVPASTRSREYPCLECGRHSATRRMRRSMGKLGKVSLVPMTRRLGRCGRTGSTRSDGPRSTSCLTTSGCPGRWPIVRTSLRTR